LSIGEEDGISLRGDLLVKCFEKSSNGNNDDRLLLFQCQFNTCALELPLNQPQLVFYKPEMDLPSNLSGLIVNTLFKMIQSTVKLALNLILYLESLVLAHLNVNNILRQMSEKVSELLQFHKDRIQPVPRQIVYLETLHVPTATKTLIVQKVSGNFWINK
jgi:hypothetical protein